MGGGLVLVHDHPARRIAQGPSDGEQGGAVLLFQAGEEGHTVAETVVVPRACTCPEHAAAPVFTCADDVDVVHDVGAATSQRT